MRSDFLRNVAALSPRQAGRRPARAGGDRPEAGSGALACCVLLALLATACGGSRELRGRSTPSSDGGTWLVIEDDQGGRCSPVLVDGQPWPHPVGTPARVRPGPHWRQVKPPPPAPG